MTRVSTRSTGSVTDEIDELDEIGADEQLVLIWSDTHEDYEWHCVPFSELPARYRP